jgi:hypothetical protein
MEDLVPTIPVPAKMPRVRAKGGETVKRLRGRLPKKFDNSRTAKRVPAVAGKESETENFDIGGFTDLDDSGSEMERRPPKSIPVKQGR